MEENHNLNSLAGLESLSTIEGNLMVLINSTLKNLHGLEGLTNIGGELYISYNDVMSDLTGLENLESIGGGIRCWSNYSLIELSALYGLTEVGGQLSIRSNDALSSLNGLDNISPASISDLDISFHDLLSTCHVQSICDYLIAPNGEVSISGNAIGCNSPDEVKDSCEANSVAIEDLHLTNNLSIYPNPFTTYTTIEFELNGKSKIQISIYNTIGEKVYQAEESYDQGTHKITWSPDPLPAGMYYCVLRGEEGVSVIKMIKQCDTF